MRAWFNMRREGPGDEARYTRYLDIYVHNNIIMLINSSYDVRDDTCTG